MAAAEWGGGVALPAVKHLDPVVGIDVHSVLVTPGTPPVFLPHPYVGFMLDRREYIDAALGVIGSIVFTFTPLGKEAEAGLKWAKKHAKAELMSDPLIAEGVKLGKEAAPVAGDIAGAVGAGVGMGSMMGRPIFVNGFLRATAGTHSFHVPGLHFPLGESFAPPPEDFEPSNDGESYMGSRTVLANNDPMSFMALPAMSCWSVGLEPPPHNGAHTQRTALSMPSSVMLPIPVGRPVLVGGPPVMNMAALASSLFKAFRGSDWAKALADKLHLKPGFLRCNVLRAEPVDAITGEVVVQQHDFTVPGRLPLVWNRYYTSHDTYVGAVGIGWQTPADIRLELTRHEGAVGVVAYFPDHATAFDAIPDAAGWPARVYDWQHGQALYRQDDRLVLRTRAGFEYEFALPAHWQHALERLAEDATLTLPVERMADLNGNAWVFERGLDSSLTRLVEWKAEEATGRMIACAASASSRAGDHVSLLTALTLIDAGGRAHPLVSYQHDRNVDLVAALDAMSQPHHFVYADGHRMVRHTSARGVSFNYSHRQHDDGVWRVDHAWGDNGLLDYRFVYDFERCETRITDSLGHTTVLQANERGMPVAKIDALGGVWSYRYDAQGRASAEIDPAGRTVTWQYDPYGNLLAQTLPDRSVVRVAYNADHKPICLTAPGDRQWHYAWDERGNLLVQTTPTQAAMRYEYDRHGQLVAHTGPRGAVTRFEYDRDGNIEMLTDALGHHTWYTHNARANVVQTVNALGQVSRYEYDRNGNLTRAIEPGEREIFCSYDADGNLVRYRDPNDQVTQLEYSALGQTTKRLTSNGGEVQYRYDTEGRLIGVVNERGELYQLQRDALGRIVAEVDYWGQPRRYVYGVIGELLRSVDPLGQAIDYATDTLGRIVQKRVPDPRQPDGLRTETFSYDGAGNLVVAENPDSRVELTYDGAGRVVKEKQGADFAITNVFDAEGYRIERRTRLQAGSEIIAHTVRYDYDALGAVGAIRLDDAAAITFERDALGQLRVEHLSAVLRRELSYTPERLLAKQTLLAGTGALFGSEYAYEANGELVEKRDSRFGIERFEYDPVGKLTGHIDPTGKLHRFLYDPAGDLLRTHVCERSAAGAADMDQTSTWVREGEYDGCYYAFDRIGNLVRKQDALQDLLLRWDGDGLLIETVAVRRVPTTVGDSSAMLRIHTRYGYDVFHRRVRKIVFTEPAGSANPMASHISHFFWDSDALLTEYVTDRGKVAALDSVDNGITSPRLVQRNRDSKDAGPLFQRGRAYEWVYYPGTFRPLAAAHCDWPKSKAPTQMKDQSPTALEVVFFYQNDQNGAPVRMLGADGEVVWETNYSATGCAECFESEHVKQPIRLQGQYFDQESGLHYNRHRYFDSHIISFICQDPIRLHGGTNIYRYFPNTLHWIDPLGLDSGSDDTINLVRQLSRDIDPKFKEIFQCKKFADELKKKMMAAGIRGDYVTVKSIEGPLAHRDYLGGTTRIEENGEHVLIGIKAGNETIVFDNLHPEGMEVNDWLRGLFADTRPEITAENFCPNTIWND
ncbi:RHS repeat-associated core domain-containing protein [Burkholderia pseudomallei]|uniref:RHS repeat-associated core domain-containing protein n=1 Tax=Burkholderia pseudomallei TaxID=28450 RepID=UPI000F574420|nr:RHS repeat-associated core domain-containing protein [Burkholderia pseudomallei]MBM5587525.1 type IV secretion protein Rhs [Burkholderia pseudomallei]RPA00531.1 type IV secretion protein Rhs [Burkholderia pseudomallei]